MNSDLGCTKVYPYKNKLLFSLLLEVCAFVLSYNLYESAGNVVTAASVVIVLLPLLYPLLSKNALSLAYFDQNGVVLRRFCKVIATHLWTDSEVGVFAKKSGKKYNYYVYISKPHPALESSDIQHIIPFTLNDESVLAFVTYYGGDYVGNEVLEDRHREVFDRAKRAIHTVTDRQTEKRGKADARKRTEDEKRRAKERKKKKK